MSFLGRKFARSKWQNKNVDGNQPSADALTTCLKTSGNTLSFWRCEEDSKVDAERVVLAMASKGDRCDKFHVVLIPKSDFIRLSIALDDNEKGDTPVNDLRFEHINADRLNGARLLGIGEIIASQCQSEVGCYTFTEKEVQRIITRALQDGRLPAFRLKRKLRLKLGLNAYSGLYTYLKEFIGSILDRKID